MIPGVKPWEADNPGSETMEANDIGSKTAEAETERNGGDRNYGIDELRKMQETV